MKLVLLVTADLDPDHGSHRLAGLCQLQKDEALAAMRTAAGLEAKTDKHPVTPAR